MLIRDLTAILLRTTIAAVSVTALAVLFASYLGS